MTHNPSFRLFVYGTLAPNRANHHIMTPIDGEWQPAFVNPITINQPYILQ